MSQRDGRQSVVKELCKFGRLEGLCIVAQSSGQKIHGNACNMRWVVEVDRDSRSAIAIFLCGVRPSADATRMDQSTKVLFRPKHQPGVQRKSDSRILRAALKYAAKIGAFGE